MFMSIVDICRTNALLFSKKICGLNHGPFPEYFDWSDHIGTSEPHDYPYHLNNTATEVDTLAAIFKPHIETDYYEPWHNNWHEQTLAAAWIHDIGMLKSRIDHGIWSAKFLFGENNLGFDFKGIGIKDRIKIGLLCIRHNNGWRQVWGAMRDILQENGLHLDMMEQSFVDKGLPKWELDFAGKLISVADFLRYRGEALRNDLKQPFFLWSECMDCKIMYDRMRDFCSATNCNSTAGPSPKTVIRYSFDKNVFDPKIHPDYSIYHKTASGVCNKEEDKINDTLAYVRVRDDYQIHARGDMSLSDVKVVDFKVWRDDLIARGVDCRKLDEYIPDQEEGYVGGYKTVVNINLDVVNQDAAIFTLAKYITNHLHQNLATEVDSDNMVFTNNVILHINIPAGPIFSKYFSSVLDNPGLAPEAGDAVKRFGRSIQRWKELDDIVLPMEITGNGLEVITL